MTEKSPWLHILSKEELANHYALMATCDMRFSNSQREFYERQTAIQLRGHINAAWHASDSSTFQLARSYFFHMTGERYGNGGL